LLNIGQPSPFWPKPHVVEPLGIDNPSDEYLAGYLGSNEQIPSISLDCVMKAAGLIERMGRARLGARKEKEYKRSDLKAERVQLERPPDAGA
jgi:hypothetical protein